MPTATTSPTPTLVTIQGQAFAWTESEGLAPEAVGAIDGYLYQLAIRLSYPAQKEGYTVDDLVQDGRLAALCAAKTFDPSRGISFLGYAGKLARWAMLDTVNAGIVKIPTEVRKVMYQNGLLPTVMTLDLQDEDETWANQLPAISEELTETTDLAAQLEGLVGALEALPHLDREILTRRFGLGCEPQTILDVARTLALGPGTISKGEVRALRRLRRAMVAPCEFKTALVV